MEKYVYYFGQGDKTMKQTLGGKGANLSEMTKLGIPVPPGFTITAKVCKYYYEHDKKYPKEMYTQIDENLKKLEQDMGAKLGNPDDPLLVSVRSGAAVSMPGMMDTVLNLGLNDSSVKGLIKKTGNERFGWDSYRRFIQMFGNVVLGIPHHDFEEELQKIKSTKGVDLDTDLSADDLTQVVEQYKKVYEKHGKSFPDDPREQLQKSIDAVFGSWNN
ncbi:pyruvate, phosphate dikinase, partial [Candidatus Woesearchaeota archaeon]|nr:pyruvate, phosphate dikinase [Candidatus Woesearchaeota archaeon]